MRLSEVLSCIRPSLALKVVIAYIDSEDTISLQPEVVSVPNTGKYNFGTDLRGNGRLVFHEVLVKFFCVRSIPNHTSLARFNGCTILGSLFHIHNLIFTSLFYSYHLVDYKESAPYGGYCKIIDTNGNAL